MMFMVVTCDISVRLNIAEIKTSNAMKTVICPILVCSMLVLLSCDFNNVIPEDELAQIAQSDNSEDALAEGRIGRNHIRNGNFERLIDFNDPEGRHATW